MGERFVEIEAEFLSVLGHATPATLGEGGAVGQQPHVGMMMMRRWMRHRILDDGQLRHRRFGKLDHIPTILVFKMRQVIG
jgi:hypothetical protein